MMKSERKDSGFTLVEILLVVIIIGIVAGIAVVGLGNSQKNTLRNSCKTNFKTVIAAITIYQNDSSGELPKDAAGDLSLDALSPEYITPGLLEFEQYSFGIVSSDSPVGYSIVIFDRDKQRVPNETTNAPEACSSL